MILAESLNPAPDGKIEFSYVGCRRMPENSGCYALTTHNGTVLYVGQAINICTRMEQHLNDGEKRKATPWGVVFWLYYKFCEPHEMGLLENGWFNDCLVKGYDKPYFNKIRPPT